MATRDEMLAKLRRQMDELALLKEAIKMRSRVFHASQKEIIARFCGLPAYAFYNLTYDEFTALNSEFKAWTDAAEAAYHRGEISLHDDPKVVMGDIWRAYGLSTPFAGWEKYNPIRSIEEWSINSLHSIDLYDHSRRNNSRNTKTHTA